MRTLLVSTASPTLSPPLSPAVGRCAFPLVQRPQHLATGISLRLVEVGLVNPQFASVLAFDVEKRAGEVWKGIAHWTTSGSDPCTSPFPAPTPSMQR